MRVLSGQLNRPTLIVHADWGSQPNKRWMARAEHSEGCYQVKSPEQVGELVNFLQRLKVMTGPDGCILLGFDFPIGLPFAYAQNAAIEHFIDALLQFGQGEWGDFYNVAETPDQISIHRPFYPYRPGGTTRRHLLEKLGFHSFESLLRACEKSPPLARPAAPLFWTLGAQQVGKAALTGWERIIAPGVQDPTLEIVIWPFSGRMSELLQPGRIILAETYPALYLHQLHLIKSHRIFSKRRQSDRVEAAEGLFMIARERSIKIHPDLEIQLREGFGLGKDGEDRFDAVLGLFGMLQFINGNGEVPEPSSSTVTQIEGWIFGLPADQVIV